MMRFLASSVLTLLGNTLGLVFAALLLPNFHIHPIGFVISIIFFTGIEILFKPFIMKLSLRYMPALGGGIALVTTLVGLLLTTIFTDGLTINGLSTWILAPLVIWITVVLAGIVLPMFIFKKTLTGAKRASKNSN